MKYGLILFCILLSARLLAFSRGDSGSEKGNGGIGVLCLEENLQEKLYLLEEFEALNAGHDLATFQDFEAIKSEFARKLTDKNVDIFERYDEVSLQVRDYNNWKIGKVEQTYDSYYFFGLPQHCNLVQLADQWKLKGDNQFRVRLNQDYADRLTMRQKQMLWFHEVLYFIGANYYGHTNSYLVRDFVKYLFISSRNTSFNLNKKVKAFRRNFLELPNKSLRFLDSWLLGRTFVKTGHRLVNGKMSGDFQCPYAYAVDYNGEKGIAVTLVYDKQDSLKAQMTEIGYRKENSGIPEKSFIKNFNLNLGEDVHFVGPAGNKWKMTAFYRGRQDRLVIMQNNITQNYTDVVMFNDNFNQNYLIFGRIRNRERRRVFSNGSFTSGYSITLGKSNWLATVHNRGQGCLYQRVKNITSGLFFIHQLFNR